MIPAAGTRNKIMIQARVAEGFFLSKNIIVRAMIKLIRKSPVINADISKNAKENINPQLFRMVRLKPDWIH